MNRPTAWRVTFLAVIGLACLTGRAPAAPEGEKDDAVVATVGQERILAGEVNRMLAKATGGKVASAVAEPFLRPRRWRNWSRGGWRWPTRGGAARRPRRPRSTPPWPI